MTVTKIKELIPDNTAYPPLLREIPGFPARIFVRGVLPDVKSRAVAIVGTRKATSAGLKLAEEIAMRLASAGLTVVSGLAMGIDAAAHRGALKAKGKTVAVLGNGIDSIYPRSNEQLGNEIIEFGGAIISEYPPGSPSYPANFLARNRIVSGLAEATIVIEAPERSGSLATARAAAEQGREVFVLPGSPNHPNYQGSHRLIRDGARLVASADDILADLGIENVNALTADAGELKPEESSILAALLGAGARLNIDKLVELTRLQPQTVSCAVTTLTLKGLIKEADGRYELWKL